MSESRVDKKLIVTTSWDDGNSLDLRLLDLLEKYDLKGTFYIPKNCPAFKSLGDIEIRKMAQTQEIGAHTVNHVYLKGVDPELARSEIFESKKYINELTGHEPEIFCYPGGSFDDKAKELVRAAGFIGARTVADLQYDKPVDNFEFGTTAHVYPFPIKTRNKNLKLLIRQFLLPLQNKRVCLRQLGLPISAYLSWPNLVCALFDRCLAHGDYFHLWGHSWEIEKYGMWQDLEKVLQHISRRSDCLYLSNSEALKLMNQK